ncbi:MAG: hypothetical protein E7316_06005 [Clostridiales bacterium]|nr:hypothetical protein [Clostridiales bacterium]
MNNIGLYEQITPFTNERAGTAEWCVATKDGKKYFVKKLQSPVYPSKRLGLSEEKYQARVIKFHSTERTVKSLYQLLERHNTSGTLIIPVDVMSYQYHLCTVAEYVAGNVAPEQVCRLSEWQRVVLMRTLTLALMNVHEAGVVHSDLKPENVLITQNADNGSCMLKLIDFDGSFMVSSPPEEITGDLAYFAPEIYASAAEPGIRLDQKIDVFALGIIFHVFWTGKRPSVDVGKTIGETVLNGGMVRLDPSLPASLRTIIEHALFADPKQRITLQMVYDILARLLEDYPVKLINLQAKAVSMPVAPAKSAPAPAAPAKKPAAAPAARLVEPSKEVAAVDVICRTRRGKVLYRKTETIPCGEEMVIHAPMIRGYILANDNCEVMVSVDSSGKRRKDCTFIYKDEDISESLSLCFNMLLCGALFLLLVPRLFAAFGVWSVADSIKDLTPVYSMVFKDHAQMIEKAASSDTIVMSESSFFAKKPACKRKVGGVSSASIRYLKFVPEESGYYTYTAKGWYSEETNTRGYVCDAKKSIMKVDTGSDGEPFEIEQYFAKGKTYYLGVAFIYPPADGEYGETNIALILE